MSKAVIIYDSRGGNTEMMAKAIEEGMIKLESKSHQKGL